MRKIFAGAFFLFLSAICGAQPFEQLDIHSLNEQKGLSYNSTRCFYQDSKGFLWIGTEDGLNRYDGNTIKIYRQRHGDKHSLPGNNILSLTGDDSTGLWVYTTNGIVHFFPDDEMAIDYTIGIYNGKKKNLAGQFGKIFFDANNDLCLTNEHGISFFDKQQNTFVLHTIKQAIDTIANSGVPDYFQEDKNTLLLLCNAGIARYNTATHQYQYLKATVDYFRTQPKMHLSDFIKNDDGTFWITTSCFGLIIIDEKTNSGQSFLIDKKITNRNLQNILIFIEKPTTGVFKNDIVIGTAGYGLYFIKSVEQRNFPGFEKIKNSNNFTDKQQGKIYLTTYSLFTDRNNITYIGNDKGVFSANPANQVFKKHENQFEGHVSGIIKKNTGKNEFQYYISSGYSGGLNVYDEGLNKIKSYPQVPPGTKTLKNSSINCIYTDRKNQLWICTSNGLHLHDEAKDSFKTFLPDKNDPKSIRYQKISSIIQDQDGIYWIALFEKGFQCFDDTKNIFYNLKLHTPCNDSAFVFNLMEDAENNIWIGLDKGIVKINSTRDGFTEYKFNKDDSTGLSNDEAQCFFLDKQKRVWIGTKNGLNLYESKTNTFKKYFRENGLYSDFINSLSQDSKDNIWVSTTNSVCVLNPESGKIKVYKNISAAFINCDSSGKVIIGSGGGSTNFITCNDGALIQDNVFPMPYITNLKITKDDKVHRNISTQNLTEINLSYQENYLTLDFTGVSYNEAHLNQFMCKLAGLEKEWHEIGKTRSISYAAIAPGEYDFQVMCCNGDGIWNPAIATLHISILPPFWKTWWFKILLSILFATGMYYIYLLRIKKIQAEENIKTKLAQLETQALLAQMNPHFIFNALNSIQACIVSNNNDAAYKYLNKFSMLVRSILQNSREQFITLSSELEVLKNYLELEQLRFKDLEFNFQVDKEINESKIKVPSTFLQPFVENAIIHGLAHKEGRKQLGILISKTGDDLVFKIKDNGIGRKKSGEMNRNRTKSHTSIGMNLISSRLKLINEQYKVNSKVTVIDLEDAENKGMGTEVIILLPVALQEELF